MLLLVDVVGWYDYYDIFKSIFKNITETIYTLETIAFMAAAMMW